MTKNLIKTNYKETENNGFTTEINNSKLTIIELNQQQKNQKINSKKRKKLPATREEKSRSIKLRDQLFWKIIPTVLIPLLIASGLEYYNIQKRAEKEIRAAQYDKALAMGEIATEILKNAIKTPETLAINPLIINAAKAGSEEVETAKLQEIPIEELEQRYGETKLLKPNKILNDYLREVNQKAGLGEIFFTERNGLNIAYSNPTSDFVQRDESWWEKGKKENQFIADIDFDESANTFSIDIIQAIIEPETGEFLGVIKAVLPANRFELLETYLEHQGIKNSQYMQIVDINNGKSIATITAEGEVKTQEVMGGEVVLGIATELINKVQNPEKNITENWQNSVSQLTISPFIHATQEKILTASFIYQGTLYTIATISDRNWVAIAAIDTAEITAVGNDLIKIFGGTAIFLGIVAVFVVMSLAEEISTPLRNLSKTAEEVIEGNLDVKAQLQGTVETQTLAQTFNNLLTRVKNLLEEQKAATKQARLLAEISNYRILNQQELQQVFNQALTETRKLLLADRVVVYRFNSDYSGYISNESVGEGWPIALNNKIEDPCISKQLLEEYKKGRIVPTNDVFNAGFHPDHEELMMRLEIKANLVVPILNQGQLYGLLIAHHCQNTHQWVEREINFLVQLAAQLGVIIERVTFIKQQDKQAKTSEELKDIILKIATALTPQEVLEIAVKEVRIALKTDRVIVYQFDEKFSGTVIAEAIGEKLPVAMGATINDPCFAQKYVEKYRQGRVQAYSDIYKAGLTECHLQQLESFAVKANLVVPIIIQGKLFGLLIAHQCDAPRNWQQGEMDFLSQIATQIGLAKVRVELLEKQQKSEAEQREAKEELQKRALELLIEVDPISKGDLTIRASVQEDEIGTIADSYNAMVESLRRIVVDVKRAAEQVATTTNTNEEAVVNLSMEAKLQSQEITEALEQLQAMSQSIASVALAAEQAEAVVEATSQSVEAGDVAMTQTVKGIDKLRTTVVETAEKVKRLGESSKDIAKVVNLIGRFAAQTHLLALKASIEAARAGEQGRGFAVIADEVRSLAAQSSDATVDIEKVVAQIEAETKEVVAAMEAGRVEVEEGTKMVELTRQNLNKITVASAQLSELVGAIANASFEQSVSSLAVTETMSDVAEIAERTSTSSVTVSNSFKDLTDVATRLQNEVAKFKVISH